MRSGGKACKSGQKAPSAKRRIKTGLQTRMRIFRTRVRRHRAPKGALRHPDVIAVERSVLSVRKHRAPKGALRLGDNGKIEGVDPREPESTERQKAH